MLCPSNVYGDNGLTPREVAKRKTNLRNQQGQVNNHLHPVYELIDYVKINDQYQTLTLTDITSKLKIQCLTA